MILVSPAKLYQNTLDLWIVTTYFNPCNYRTKLENYYRFVDTIQRAGLNLLTVECAFVGQEFVLPQSSTIQIRARDWMWQKERLLNLAIDELPACAEKVAWLDCDVMFSNENWAVETTNQLDKYAVVQPFSYAHRLPKGKGYYNVGQENNYISSNTRLSTTYSSEDAKNKVETFKSFAYIYNQNPAVSAYNLFNQHGHTGFAWAARREILQKNKLYDCLISGSADHLMAHAFCGQVNARCVTRWFKEGSDRLKQHFYSWARNIYTDVQGSIGYVPGHLLHLWHGSSRSRFYITRHDELIRSQFDPEVDLVLSPSGAWEWSQRSTKLKDWAREYFFLRNEDEL